MKIFYKSLVAFGVVVAAGFIAATLANETWVGLAIIVPGGFGVRILVDVMEKKERQRGSKAMRETREQAEQSSRKARLLGIVFGGGMMAFGIYNLVTYDDPSWQILGAARSLFGIAFIALGGAFIWLASKIDPNNPVILDDEDEEEQH